MCTVYPTWHTLDYHLKLLIIKEENRYILMIKLFHEIGRKSMSLLIMVLK